MSRDNRSRRSGVLRSVMANDPEKGRATGRRRDPRVPGARLSAPGERRGPGVRQLPRGGGRRAGGAGASMDAVRTRRADRVAARMGGGGGSQPDPERLAPSGGRAPGSAPAARAIGVDGPGSERGTRRRGEGARSAPSPAARGGRPSVPARDEHRRGRGSARDHARDREELARASESSSRGSPRRARHRGGERCRRSMTS